MNQELTWFVMSYSYEVAGLNNGGISNLIIV